MKLLTILLLIYLGFTAGTCSTKPGNRNDIQTGKGKVTFSIKGIAVSAPVDKIDSTNLLPLVEVNANSIAVIPYAFCRMPEAEVRFNRDKQWWGEKDAGVVETVRMAHAQGMSVMVKPHLWFPGGEYTGHLKFENEAQAIRWENSYADYIIHFAKISEYAKVNLFCVGTELGSVAQNRPMYFSRLIDSVKKYFSGKITYAANWDDYEKFPSWSKLDYIGIDSYFPLSNERYPSVQEMEAGWKSHKDIMQSFASSYKKQILFTEYGYRNVAYTAKEPWAEKEKEKYDQGQSDALTAFYNQFGNEPWFAGGYLWKWYVDTRQLEFNRDIDFTPQGKPALNTVRQYY